MGTKPFLPIDNLQYKTMIGPNDAPVPHPGGGTVGDYNKVQTAKNALLQANAKFPSPTPPASLNTGVGHGIGVAFAQAHGSDHTGSTPAPAQPVGYVQDVNQGLQARNQNVNEYLNAPKQ